MTRQVVHVRVNDSATNRPTPVRLRLADPAGRSLPPLGWPAVPGDLPGTLRGDERPWFYTDGACEALLPPGPIHVEVAKGPEFAPVRQTVDLKPGQLALRLTVERRFDLAAEGWFAGDTHARGRPPHAAALEGAAEGLRCVQLLATADRPADLLHFSGQEPALVRHGCQVVANTGNDGGDLGRLTLLHSHRPIFPLRLSAPGFERFTLSDWCPQCHRKGGLVVWPDFPGIPGEAIAALLTGGIDAVEWTAGGAFPTEGLAAWYRLLDLGLRIPLVGGSGTTDNRRPLGAVRTLVHLDAGQELTCKAWIEAIRAGRTVATRGPVVAVVNPTPPPPPLNGEGEPAKTQAVGNASGLGAAPPSPLGGGGPGGWGFRARSVLPFDRLDVVADGQVIASAAPGPDGTAALAVAPPPCRWLAARCWDARGLAAHTSPVYFPGRPKAPAGLARPLLDQLAALAAFAEDRAHPAQKAHLLEVAAAARTALEKRLA